VTIDTIAAVATPLGEGGIGIVRISGPQAVTIADQIFKAKRGERLKDLPTYQMRYGKVINPKTGQALDEALALVMLGPHSYTGEDVVELQTHGGVVVVREILQQALELGAEVAAPGEFTKRAFLNGRLDLAQAEAVIDIVRSRTELGLQVAVDQLEGSLSRRIGAVKERLYGIVVRVEAMLDFPEDDVPDLEIGEMEEIISLGLKELDALIATSDDGKVLREGLKTVITGKPNVGKSSLLNRLLNENRALVTDIPGTTRDTIEEVVNLRGLPLRLIDTAGIRRGEDLVERLGVERSLEVLAAADLVLHVVDSSVPLEKEDFEILERAKDKKRIILINKIDLPPAWEIKELGDLGSAKVLKTSFLKGDLAHLIDAILAYAGGGFNKKAAGTRAIITRTRHKQSLKKAKTALEQALKTLREGFPVDLITVDLYTALENLGEITGETVRENVLDRIFEQFCIGK